MSVKSETGLAAQSVQKWVIDSDVEYQLCSETLVRRLLNKSLSHGTIEIYLKCSNYNRAGRVPTLRRLRLPHSLLRVDLTGCPKLRGIPEFAFDHCRSCECGIR